MWYKKACFWIPTGLFLFGVLARVLFLLFYGLHSPPIGDEPDYLAIANNLLARDGFSVFPGILTAYRTPGYPVLLCPVLLVAGGSLALARFVQIAISSLIVVILYHAGKNLVDERFGVVSAFLGAIYPGFLYLSMRFLTESFFTLFVALSIFLSLSMFRRYKPYQPFLLGLCLGYGVLVRANLALFLPFAAGWPFAVFRFKRALWASLSSMLVAGLVILPWIIRNYIVFDHHLILTTGGGISFFLGNNTASPGYGKGLDVKKDRWVWEKMFGKVPDVVHFPSGMLYISGLSEYESDRSFYSVSTRWIRENPRDFTLLLPRKVFYLFSPFSTSNEEFASKYALAYGAFQVIFLLLAVVGLLMTAKKARPLLFSYLMVTSFVLVALIYFGSSRLRTPLDSFGILLAAAPLRWLWGKISPASPRSPVP